MSKKDCSMSNQDKCMSKKENRKIHETVSKKENEIYTIYKTYNCQNLVKLLKIFLKN